MPERERTLSRRCTLSRTWPALPAGQDDETFGQVGTPSARGMRVTDEAGIETAEAHGHASKGCSTWLGLGLGLGLGLCLGLGLGLG